MTNPPTHMLITTKDHHAPGAVLRIKCVPIMPTMIKDASGLTRELILKTTDGLGSGTPYEALFTVGGAISPKSVKGDRIRTALAQMTRAGWHREVNDIESDHWDVYQDLKNLATELDEPTITIPQSVLEGVVSALADAESHLNYIGWGDAWEREGSEALQGEICKAQEAAEQYLPQFLKPYEKPSKSYVRDHTKNQTCKCGRKFSVYGLADHQRDVPDCLNLVPKPPKPPLVRLAQRFGIQIK